MTTPQSPAPAQSLLDEMAAALKPFADIGLIRDRRLDAIDTPDLSIAPKDVRNARNVLNRYRATKEAVPDLVAALEQCAARFTIGKFNRGDRFGKEHYENIAREFSRRQQIAGDALEWGRIGISPWDRTCPTCKGTGRLPPMGETE